MPVNENMLALRTSKGNFTKARLIAPTTMTFDALGRPCIDGASAHAAAANANRELYEQHAERLCAIMQDGKRLLGFAVGDRFVAV